MQEPDFIIGVDECGRGSIAGPLVVCAFAAKIGWTTKYLNDSKKVSSNRRELLFRQLTREHPQSYEVLWMTSQQVDEKGIEWCNREAMRLAANTLIARVGTPYRVIFDGEYSPIAGGEAYPKADGTYPAVMAASIIGKVSRDHYMKQLHQQYTCYDFFHNMGYGSEKHLQGLIQHGTCPEHRRSFRPIKNMYAEEQKKLASQAYRS